MDVEAYSLTEETTVDGLLVSVGNKRKNVNVSSFVLRLSGSQYVTCQGVTMAQIKELGAHINEDIRVYGMGSWERKSKSSGWKLKSLEFSSFTILDSTPLKELFAQMP